MGEKELIQQLITFMDCPCQTFPSMEDDDEIHKAYQKALEQGKKEGFVPVLLGAEDMLLEDLVFNCGADDPKDIGQIRAVRKKRLEDSAKEGFAAESIHAIQEQVEKFKSDPDALKEALDPSAKGELVDGFTSYWNTTTLSTYPVILAEIPVKEPWQIFAWVCIGGWNEFPDTDTLMALSKKWFIEYGAVPAAAVHDVLEFYLDRPVSDRESAANLAIEHYIVCCDRVEQAGENETIGTLADSLTKSNFWFFWWD